ncbi:MAG: RagB/SusD family nutrient uptake outer membrane protein [Candidatus Phocaeicola faecigallinarum]|uniref:RagB/SusD family nutrient uptake outer membrane protein n=1 Tax=Candidatus Phocaeicola faecigallinarum TaxID=2838732 RepID=A0A948TDP8_9BACT|nr:RagB/SusD family nutrient uptake outer membrane protein [Candidatus Phocaeicola faecigallinarum]
MKRINILLAMAFTIGLSGCFDLDKMPEGVLSTANPFQSVGEIRNYVDRYYESGLIGQGFMAGGGGGIAGQDYDSDNMTGPAANTRLMGQSSLSNAVSISNYTYVRDINFLLNNIDNCPEKGSKEFNQLKGEALYFRGWYYYRMLINYGELAWVDKPLEPNLEIMMLPRESRTFIVDKILEDLGNARDLMGEQSNSSSMRLHKDVARALISEVALFEATWERYHYAKEKDKSEKFYDYTLSESDLNAKIEKYLEMAITACEEVENRGVWKIYNTGDVRNDYRKLFDTPNLSTNPEILWFKMYDGDKVGNSVTRYLNTGGGNIGICASLVDDYLSKDGRALYGEELLNLKKNYPDELDPENRDPRLAQTVAFPGQRMKPERDSNPYILEWPALAGDGTAFGTNLTGYVMLKHVQIDCEGDYISEFKGTTPAIQFRYADVLLNHAEALAEQNGAANAAEIIRVLQPLRERAGMPSVDFDREYNDDPNYPFSGLDKYIQAVRRERRVETALEGKRFKDILRWAAAEELIIGKRPMGALFTGSNLPEQYGNNLKINLSGNDGDALRYILPVQPSSMPQGWQFKPNRDYLQPINETMLGIMDGLWKQNPGW